MKLRQALLSSIWVCALAACRQDMHDQPRYEPLEVSTFFADGRSSRPRVPGTVARGELFPGETLLTGRVGDELADAFPILITPEVLDRGRQRFDIHCAPCHDRLGYGDGMIVQRGFPRPPSMHLERLREAPPGHFFDVMTRGLGAMYDVADRVSPQDRWAIAAHIRVLQASQAARLEDVAPEARRELEESR